MPHFRYDDYKSIELCNDSEKIVFGFVEYHLQQNGILKIKELKNNNIFNSPKYVGTTILNELLIRLNNHNLVFNRIVGTLALMDAENGNWYDSIPFYFNFPNYLNKNLPYKLQCEIYDYEGLCWNIDRNTVNFETKLTNFINKHKNARKDALLIFMRI